MADEKERSVPFAKSVDGLHQEENALDRARGLKEKFERAENLPEQQKSQETEQSKGGAQQAGSPMVKQDAPVMRPTPSGSMREPDRQAAYGKLAKERSAENQKLDAAKMAQEFRDRQQKSHDPEHDRDRER